MKLCNTHNNCIDSAINKAEAICLKNKLQFTRLRKSILKLIWESHVPLRAYDILERLKISETSAKPITVYRILDFLLENKLIHKLESQNSFLGCTHPGEEHNCYFIICKKCQIVEEGCKEDILKTIYNSLDKLNFSPLHITLEIQGICKNCSNL